MCKLRGDQGLLRADHCQRLWDVVIAGAGPAGAVCALYLARFGHQVLLIDKARFPRDKPCGDVLIPDAITVLKRARLYNSIRQIAHELNTIIVYSPSQIRLDVPGEYLSLRRTKLDMLLVNKAIEAGATLVQGNIRDARTGQDGASLISVAGSAESVRARVCVLATGGAVTLARRAGIVSHKESSGMGVRTYVYSSRGPSLPIFSYDHSLVPGYSWIVPLGNDYYNVGCGILYTRTGQGRHSLKELLGQFLSTFPLAVELMCDGEQVSPIRGAPIRCGLAGTSCVVNGSIVGIGETIGTTFPFSGEGIGKAMHTGELAAMAINNTLRSDDLSDLQQYPERLQQEVEPLYRGYQVAQRWLSYSWLNDFVARRITKSSYLQKCLRDFIAETGDPRSVYSLWSILRSFFK